MKFGVPIHPYLTFPAPRLSCNSRLRQDRHRAPGTLQLWVQTYLIVIDPKGLVFKMEALAFNVRNTLLKYSFRSDGLFRCQMASSRG